LVIYEKIEYTFSIFTCSLACYSSGLSFEECYDEMDQFNSELKDLNGHSASLKDSEVVKIIKSAYSGKYTGASKEFIQELLSLYTGSTYNPSVQQNGRVAREKWVKHAKPREEREKSHYKEWAADLINYINKKTTSARPYIQTDRETICKALGMPESTYKDLMRQLKKDQMMCQLLALIILYLQHVTSLLEQQVNEGLEKGLEK
jgi:hypothetical protein